MRRVVVTDFRRKSNDFGLFTKIWNIWRNINFWIFNGDLVLYHFSRSIDDLEYLRKLVFQEMLVFVRFLRKICHYWPFWENRHNLEYIRELFFGEILHFLGKWIVWKMWRDNFSSCLFCLLRRITHFNILRHNSMTWTIDFPFKRY